MSKLVKKRYFVSFLLAIWLLIISIVSIIFLSGIETANLIYKKSVFNGKYLFFKFKILNKD